MCSLLRALGVGRPEVARHVSEALRHVTLAAKAIVEAHVDGAHRTEEPSGATHERRPPSERDVPPRGSRFERIRVDE